MSLQNLKVLKKILLDQEAVVLSGSLRHNLDFLAQRTDAQILSSIEAVGLSHVVHDLGGLDGDLQNRVG